LVAYPSMAEVNTAQKPWVVGSYSWAH